MRGCEKGVEDEDEGFVADADADAGAGLNAGDDVFLWLNGGLPGPRRLGVVSGGAGTDGDGRGGGDNVRAAAGTGPETV